MKKYSIELKWGFIFFVVTLLWVFFEKAMGWHDTHINRHPLYTNLFGLLAVAIYLLAIYDKRRNFFQGQMTWQQGFLSGVVLSLFIAVLAPAGQWIIHEFISPNFFENAIDYSTTSQKMAPEDARAYFSLRSYIIQAISGALMMGVVTAAIVAFILRTRIRT